MTDVGGGVSVQVRQLIAAPRQEVFDAFTQPEQLQHWWGPGDFVTGDLDVDLRTGGGYRFAMHAPEDGAPSIVVAGRYERVEPPARLAFTWKFVEGPPASDPESYVTVDFVDCDGDTEVIVTHGRFPAGFDMSNYTFGWESGLGKLAARARAGSS